MNTNVRSQILAHLMDMDTNSLVRIAQDSGLKIQSVEDTFGPHGDAGSEKTPWSKQTVTVEGKDTRGPILTAKDFIIHKNEGGGGNNKPGYIKGSGDDDYDANQEMQMFMPEG